MTETERDGVWLLSAFAIMQEARPIPTEELPDTDIDNRQFRQLLRTYHKPIMQQWFANEYLPWLNNRGIPANPQEDQIEQAIESALTDTEDILLTIHLATTAAFSLDIWRAVAHQAQILRDLSRRAADYFEKTVLRRTPPTPLTGRVRWNTISPNSRHAALSQIPASEDGKWLLNGRTITSPRHDPSNPNEWSGCSCYLTYETEEGTWI